MKRPDRLIKMFFFLWLVCFVCSFSLPFLLKASGDGFTRGLNRLGALMGWQLGATVFAFFGFISGIGKCKGHPSASWLSRGPAIVQTTLIVALIGLILNARFASTPKPETDYLPPKVTNVPAAAKAFDATSAKETVTQTEVYSGIYHRGFEASHFSASDGWRPWTVETSSEADQALGSFSQKVLAVPKGFRSP